MTCYWCQCEHEPSLLCDAASQVLDRLRDQIMGAAARYDMPTVELTNDAGVEVEGVLVKAFAMRSFYVDTLGVYRPAIAIDPILLDDSTLKPLILIDSDGSVLRRCGRLFDEMCTMAIRKATKARDEAFKSRSV